jgi:hypothetical protein
MIDKTLKHTCFWKCQGGWKKSVQTLIFPFRFCKKNNNNTYTALTTFLKSLIFALKVLFIEMDLG